VDNNGEGTTFVQWRQRAQSEVSADRPGLRIGLILAAVLVVAVIVGVVVFLMS
jgi:hypothetical protein